MSEAHGSVILPLHPTVFPFMCTWYVELLKEVETTPMTPGN